MHYRRLEDIRNDLFSGKITFEQLVASYLLRIHERKQLNVFLEIFEHEALEKARHLDELIRTKKQVGKLAGMVIALKDNIAFKGHLVSASSKILKGYTSVYSATIVDRLLKEDAIIIGRVNCDEFAMGSSNEKSAYGPVLNPVDESRVPGGSSGGSAAAVAADLCLAALGSDTGGSIRQPASFCGVVGLKPTYGRVSRYGLIAYGSSFDQIGPITHSIEDAALIMEIISGKDEKDATSSSKVVEQMNDVCSELPKSKFAILDVIADHPNIQAAVKKSFLHTIEKLKEAGHEIETVSFPYLDYLIPSYYVLSTAEASSNLSRYDGIHFGYRSENATDLDSTYKKSRSEGLGMEVKRRIMLGTFVLSSGYYDAYYTKAQKVRRLLKNATMEIFKTADFILLPSTPATAFPFGQKSNDPIAMYLEDIFTVQANLTGVPAISVPAGEDENNLPIGMQLMGRNFEEKKLLQAGNTISTFFK
jgi:aspartyl-tRNA(Asn)/glutamyl-tRNA(Gln) amidotransferase subunit A